MNLDGFRLGRSLEAALRAAVRDGRLPPGTRLPSSRALAADLGIARNTVADAYGQLVAEGWLTARAGAGTWVTGQDLAQALPALAAVTALSRPARPPRYDLHPGVPDLSAFPRREWLAAARRALAASADDVLNYPELKGVPGCARHSPDTWRASAASAPVRTGSSCGGWLRFIPDPELAGRVLARLFPWHDPGDDAWQTLLWANGRIDLPGRSNQADWIWHCAPLADWNGQPTQSMAPG